MKSFTLQGILLGMMLCTFIPSISVAQSNFKLADNGITIIYTGQTPGETGEINGRIYTAVNKEMLVSMIQNAESIEFVATSLITDMSGLFADETGVNFNGDLSRWDVSNVTTMERMFINAKSFNVDLSEWDVSNVTNMGSMFYQARSFNRNLSKWDVSSVTDMSSMFNHAISFNGDVSDWNVSNVTTMETMFFGTRAFNGNLSAWNVSNVTNMRGMFSSARSFNSSIKEWNVSKVTTMANMFADAQVFNKNISDWDVSKVSDMGYMFYYAKSFNSDLTGWCVKNIQAQPVSFALVSSLSKELYPQWGTCGNTVSIESPNIPLRTTLEPNYPNPFNPTTTIAYQLSESSEVRLEVYNLQGKSVATLVQGTQSAGRYSVPFNATNLSSGIYFYTLQANQYTSTQKMILIK